MKWINQLDQRCRRSYRDGEAGYFDIEIFENWKSIVKHWRNGGGKIVHLTMYGLNIDEVIDELRKCDELLVVVGASKVPRELYEVSDYNVAIGNQPHSEIASTSNMLG